MTTELPTFAPHTLREQVTDLKGSAVLGSGQWSLLMRPSQRRQGALAVTTDWPGALAIYRGSQPTAGQASEVRGPSCTASEADVHILGHGQGDPLGIIYPFF